MIPDIKMFLRSREYIFWLKRDPWTKSWIKRDSWIIVFAWIKCTSSHLLLHVPRLVMLWSSAPILSGYVLHLSPIVMYYFQSTRLYRPTTNFAREIGARLAKKFTHLRMPDVWALCSYDRPRALQCDSIIQSNSRYSSSFIKFIYSFYVHSLGEFRFFLFLFHSRHSSV